MLSLIWKVFLSWKLIKALLVNKMQNKYGPVFPYCHLLVALMCARNRERTMLEFRSCSKAWGQRSVLCTRSQICCFLRDNDKLWHFFNAIWVKCSEKRRCVALRGQTLGNLMRWVTRLAGSSVKWGRISWCVMLILEDKMSNSFSQLMQFEWCGAFGQGHLVHGVILFLQWKGSKPFLQGSFY